MHFQHQPKKSKEGVPLAAPNYSKKGTSLSGDIWALWVRVF
jgi:hypothetical protein